MKAESDTLYKIILQKAAGQARAGQRLMSEKKFLMLLALGVGVFAGLGASVLKLFISTLKHWLTGGMTLFGEHWLLLLLPVAGVLLCGIYSRYIVKDDMEYSTQRIHHAIVTRQYRMSRHLIYAPIVACSLTLGFGGSSGSEGPIAYAGAGMGSNVGKFFGLSPSTLRILIGCGAGAGIAGIFKAPIGGALFSLEVVGMQFTTLSVLALTVCCIAAWVTAYVCSGMTIDLPFHCTEPFAAGMLPAVICLGVFCGLYSVYYSFAMTKTEHLMARIGNPWLKNIVSGLLIGGCLFLFPALYGEGYGVMGDIVNGNTSDLMSRTAWMGDMSPASIMLFLVGMLAVKAIAVAATNAGGGVGGDFAPTLFAGCMAGMLFATVGDHVFNLSIPMSDFALFGMAGVMAGAIQAPLMAMFLTVEMCGDYGMLFPMMVTAAVSFTMVRALTRRFGFKLRPAWIHRDMDNFISRI